MESYEEYLINYIKDKLRSGPIYLHDLDLKDYFIDEFENLLISNEDDINNFIELYKNKFQTYKVYTRSFLKDIKSSELSFKISPILKLSSRNFFVKTRKDFVKGKFVITDKYLYLITEKYISLINQEKVKGFQKFIGEYLCLTNGKDIGLIQTNNENLPISEGKIIKIFKIPIFEKEIESLLNDNLNDYLYYYNNDLFLINTTYIDLYRFIYHNIIKVYEDVKIDSNNGKNVIYFLNEPDFSINADRIFIVSKNPKIYTNLEKYEFTLIFNVDNMKDFSIQLYEKKFINPKYIYENKIENNLIEGINMLDCLLLASCSIYQENNNYLFRKQIRDKIENINIFDFSSTYINIFFRNFSIFVNGISILPENNLNKKIINIIENQGKYYLKVEKIQTKESENIKTYT